MDRLFFDPIRSGFSNCRSDQIRSDQVFEIVDPIRFDPIRFFKSYADPCFKFLWCYLKLGTMTLSFRHNLIGSDRLDRIGSTFFRSDPIRFFKLSIRSGFSNCRSDQVRSDQVFQIVDPIRFDPIRFFKSYADPWFIVLDQNDLRVILS